MKTLPIDPLLRSLLLALSLMLPLVAPAQEAPDTTRQVTKELDRLEQTIGAGQWPDDLNASWKWLDQQRRAAHDCRTAADARLEIRRKDLTDLGESNNDETAQLRDARRGLEREIQQLSEQRLQCKNREERSERLQQAIEQRRSDEIASERLHRSPSFAELLPALFDSEALPLPRVRIAFERMGWGDPPWPRVGVFGFLALLGIAAGLGARTLLGRLLGREWKPDFTEQLLLSALTATRALAPWAGLVAFWIAGWSMLSWESQRWLPMLSLTLTVATYFGIHLAVRTFFLPLAPATPFIQWDATAAARLGRRLLALSLLTTLALAPRWLPLHEPLADIWVAGLRLAGLTLFLIVLVRFSRSYSALRPERPLTGLRTGVLTLALLVWTSELLGYRGLSLFLLRGILATLILAGAAWVVSKLWADFLDSLDEGRHRWQQRMRTQLELGDEQGIPGLVWLRLVGGAAIWVVIGWWLLTIWGVTETRRSELVGYVVDGFQVGTIEIAPSRIAIALLIFAALAALAGWFRRQLEYRWLARARMDSGAKNALVTLTGYIGIGIGLLVALSLAGVDFGNLALIAGALSVGIGFGLQNIVNNFVSGLILLFERPIRKGDWIVVGSTEGFVDKISIRSTTLRTFERADVIVPNSELLSTQVTNWMLNDTKGRVTIAVGVAYGSDVERVRDILLEIAEHHPERVRDRSVPPPRALFLNFGESSLDFQLRFFIRAIDQRMQVVSDVNFAIDAAFRKEGIEIPFPQRVVHLVREPAANDLPPAPHPG